MPINQHQTTSQRNALMRSPSAWMEEIAPFLPARYAEKAKEMHAFVRVRKLRTGDDLLRSLFCWAFVGLSLRQLGI